MPTIGDYLRAARLLAREYRPVPVTAERAERLRELEKQQQREGDR